ncbi:MAG: hypothetical protein ACXVCS_13570 [Bdellovibrionota bacterium]
MKTSILLMAILLTPLAHAEGTRGGGDDIGLEFQGELNAALDEIKASDPSLEAQVANLQLDTLYARDGASALVIDEDQKISVGGKVQDCVAVSDTSTMITTITRARWNDLKSLHLKEGIALHEALVLKKVEATGQYPISGKFLAHFGIAADSLLSGNPFPSTALGKVLTVDCKPRKPWNIKGMPVNELFLVFDGKRGLQDPALVASRTINPTLPGGPESYQATLDSDTPGKITYLIGYSFDGSFSSWAVNLDYITFDFKALTLGAVGNGVATEHVVPVRGISVTPVTHSLSCKITNNPPKG